TGLPASVVNVVPPAAGGRDHRAWDALPLRSTTAVPEPTVVASGGIIGPCPGKGDRPPTTRWINTVGAGSCPAPTLMAPEPSRRTSQRPLAADQVNRNDAAGYDTDLDLS